jgi:alginate O-acetyltransferase complex protein AlgI
VLTVAANVGLLGAFKYTGFAVDNLNPLLGWLALPQLTPPALHLPIGLSFFTFQAMSYVFDIYLGRSEAQKNPLHTALFIACFPQLLLGPIVRYRDIAAELTRRPPSAEDFALGANRFTI